LVLLGFLGKLEADKETIPMRSRSERKAAREAARQERAAARQAQTAAVTATELTQLQLFRSSLIEESLGHGSVMSAEEVAAAQASALLCKDKFTLPQRDWLAREPQSPEDEQAKNQAWMSAVSAAISERETGQPAGISAGQVVTWTAEAALAIAWHEHNKHVSAQLAESVLYGSPATQATRRLLHTDRA
jgi:hypothetical protein